MSNEHKIIRKLTAILSADVKGYSLLMADDEAHTIETLKKYRRLMADLIQQYSGRVVDNPGDNLLVEFGSAVDAVNYSVQIQNRLRKENTKFVENKRLQFRIGINIGDIVHDGDRIYGSGVNVASRIESLADTGGICISRSTYDQIKGKIDLGTEYMGEHAVKNIIEPVRVYRVLMDAEHHKPLVKEELALPDKPSVAVLPFTNMSGDPSQEYFSDGLTEQIINGLCKVSNLFVIARNSSFAYKGKAVSVKQIAKELGVRYILEGSVQRAVNRVRITAQLIDANTDYHMWSESYDRNLEDIFALQDEITIKIIDVMQIKLIYGEQARMWSDSTNNIKAYDMHMRGADCFFRVNKKDNKQAQYFFKEAISIDEKYAIPYAMLGFTHVLDLLYGWSESPLKSFEEAEKNAEKAISLNESLDVPHSLMAWIYLFKRCHEEAIKEGERAIELNPNGAEAYACLVLVLIYSDETELALKLIKRALRLNPIPPPHYYFWLAATYRIRGQYEKAIQHLKKALIGSPDLLTPYLYLTASYSSLNRTEEARKAAEEVLRIEPNFSLEYHKNILPYKNQETLNNYIEALRKAGLPN